MQRLESDPQTGIDLNPAIVVHTFTATQARSVFVRVFAGVTGGTLAGGGDYLVWIDVQLGGSGAWHRSHPITTATVAAGIVSIYLQTGAIAVSAGDVVRVYLQGLVADVAVNVTTEVWDDCIPNIAPGASGGLPLSVDATGGVNAAKIGGVAQTDGRDLATVLPATALNNAPVLTDYQQRGVAVTLPSKPAVSLAAADVTGNLPADVKAYTTQPSAPADMALNSTVAKDATVAKAATALTTDDLASISVDTAAISAALIDAGVGGLTDNQAAVIARLGSMIQVRQ